MSDYPGATTEESVKIKLATYLLNPKHPRGKEKAAWFAAALGFALDNLEELARQIVFDINRAVPTGATSFGRKYEQMISIVGANGRVIEVLFVWIANPDGVIRLVTAPPTTKKRK